MKRGRCSARQKTMVLKFSIHRGDRDGDLPVLVCERRIFTEDKNGNLIFHRDETFSLLWTLMMTALGAVVPAFMFLGTNLKGKIVAVILFLAFQAGAVLTVNAGRLELRVFDRVRNSYRIRRANHIFTRAIRRTWIDVCCLGKIVNVGLSSFQAKRWVMTTIGSGENKYKRQDLHGYEDFRVNLITIDGKKITVYDWYEMDEAMNAGQRIADFLGVPFSLE